MLFSAIRPAACLIVVSGWPKNTLCFMQQSMQSPFPMMLPFSLMAHRDYNLTDLDSLKTTRIASLVLPVLELFFPIHHLAKAITPVPHHSP
jgi:hypothetical protein